MIRFFLIRLSIIKIYPKAAVQKKKMAIFLRTLLPKYSSKEIALHYNLLMSQNKTIKFTSKFQLTTYQEMSSQILL